MRKLIFILSLSFLSLAFGQDTIRVSIEALKEKVVRDNLFIKLASQEHQMAKSDYNQTRAIFLPNLNVSHTGIATTNPLMAFGSKLNQEILTMADFNPDLLNDPNVTQNFATKIELQQPIFNLDGWQYRQAAKSKMEAMSLKTERTKEHFLLEVEKAYMQLQLAYQFESVLKKAIKTAEANLKLVENYFNNGMIQKSDVLDVQIRVNDLKNQRQYAKSNINNASDYLSFLLNEKQGVSVYQPQESLANFWIIESTSNQVSSSRKDLLAMTKASEAYKHVFEAHKFNLIPRLNAFATYEMHDKNIFGTQAKGYLVGAQLSWQVFDGLKNYSQKEKAKIDYEKSLVETESYKQQSQLVLNQKSRQLADASNKINLTKLALDKANEALRIRQNRYNQGLEKTTDLLMAETQLSQKSLEHLNAIYEYNLTKLHINFLTN